MAASSHFALNLAEAQLEEWVVVERSLRGKEGRLRWHCVFFVPIHQAVGCHEVVQCGASNILRQLGVEASCVLLCCNLKGNIRDFRSSMRRVGFELLSKIHIREEAGLSS